MTQPTPENGVLVIDENSPIDEEARNVFGWAYQTHTAEGEQIVDRSGDYVEDMASFEKAAYDFVRDSRVANVDHTEKVVGTVIESMVFTDHKADLLGISKGVLPQGWWVGMHVDDDDTWDSVKKKRRLMFSVEGSGVRSAYVETEES